MGMETCEKKYVSQREQTLHAYIIILSGAQNIHAVIWSLKLCGIRNVFNVGVVG